MDGLKRGAVAVIFTSLRNDVDTEGYAAATAAMDAEAARQPGYIGMDAVRDAAGEGITISYWQDEAAALAWRAHVGHSAIRDRGRAKWDDRYWVIVTEVTRSYRWERPGSPGVAAHTNGDSAMSHLRPGSTTGKTMREDGPPAPADSPPMPMPASDDEALIGSTAIQGVPEDEQTSKKSRSLGTGSKSLGEDA